MRSFPFHQGLLLFLLFLLAPASPAAGAPKDVLILHSYHMGQPWTDAVMAGMKRVLDQSGRDLRLQVEYMDTKRFHDPTYLTEVIEVLLTYKLQRFTFDLILLSDNDAFNFVIDNRPLFSGTPIIFCGVNNFQPEMIEGVENITGVAEVPNFRATLDLALQFHPQTRQIVVIRNSRNETDRQNDRLFQQIVPEFADRVNFVFLDDLPLPELLARLQQVGPGGIIYINGIVTDAQGRTLPFPESTRAILGATSVPLYSNWEFFLGHGIVGGRLVSGERQGELAAMLALRVLEGEDPDRLPVVEKETNVYKFDDRQLRRFGIKRSQLPAGSVIINTPGPFLALSRKEFSLALAFGTLLLLLFAVLAAAFVNRRRAERVLQKSEERFRAIADHSYDWEDWIGPRRELCWVSPSVQRHTGYSVDECLAMSDYPLPIICEEDREEMTQLLASTLDTRSSGNNYPFRIRRKGGEVRWMAVSWHPIYNNLGEWLGIRANIRDITEQRQAEEELRAVNRELDDFVRTVSHDLRTPLTPIIGHAELLLHQYGPNLDETGRWALEKIEQTGRRMLQMLEDLLALARAGYLDEPAEPVDSREVVQTILTDLGHWIASTGVSVEVAPLPPVHLPRALLAQALANLVGNAVHYAGAPDRPIEIGGEHEGERVRFYVRDHGPGIPDEEKKKIFDLFYRSPDVRQTPGTGVGLSTVRRIARRCGGSVWVEDTPGGGSTFWIEMAAARRPDERS